MKIDWDEFDDDVHIGVCGWHTCYVHKDAFGHWQWSLMIVEMAREICSGYALSEETAKMRVEEALRLDTVAYRE